MSIHNNNRGPLYFKGVTTDSGTIRAAMLTEGDLRAIQKNPALEYKIGAPIPEDHSGLIMPHGGVFSMASTQPRKMSDAKKILRAAGCQMPFLNPNQILSWFLSAEEISRTFTGNTYEKSESILNRVYNMLGYEKVIKRSKVKDIDLNNVVFCVNDCGASFNTDYSNEPEFTRSLHEKGRRPWPGVELSPVTDAQGGIVQFFSDFESMAIRKEKEGILVDFTGIEHQNYMMFKLEPRREDIKLFQFSATAPLEFQTRPVPAQDEALTTLHYTSPGKKSVPSSMANKTRALLGDDYIKFYSAESMALRSFLKFAKVPLSAKPIFSDVVKNEDRIFAVSDQHNVFSGQNFKKTPSPVWGGKELIRNEVMYDIRKGGSVQEMTNNTDAVVLGAHAPEITRNWDKYFLKIARLWLGLVVDKQVLVDTFENTPFVVINREKTFSCKDSFNGHLDWSDPNTGKEFLNFLKNINPEEDPWLSLIHLTRYYNERGLMKHEPRFLYRQFDPDNKEALNSYLISCLNKLADRKEIASEYEPEEYGRDRFDLPEIVILGSASTRVQSYTKAAYELAYWAASQGFHIRTGGGRYGVMGAAYEGAMAYRKAHPHRSDFHFSAIQMPRTMYAEGVVFDPVKIKNSENFYLRVEPNFDLRMRNLLRSHIPVDMSGGIGSCQEVNEFAFLQEEGILLPGNRKMIVVNQELPGMPGFNLMDPYLAITPASIKERNFVITHDVEDTKSEIVKMLKKDKMFQTPQFAGLQNYSLG